MITALKYGLFSAALAATALFASSAQAKDAGCGCACCEKCECSPDKCGCKDGKCTCKDCCKDEKCASQAKQTKACCK